MARVDPLLPFLLLLLAWTLECLAAWILLQQPELWPLLAIPPHILASLAFAAALPLTGRPEASLVATRSSEAKVDVHARLLRLRQSALLKPMFVFVGSHDPTPTADPAQGRLRLWRLMGGAICLFGFPLIGIFAATLAYFLSGTSHSLTPERVAELPGLEEEEPHAAEKAISAAARQGSSVVEELEIEPLVDLLQEEAPDVKANAIDFLVRNRNKALAPILLGLLRSTNPDVRFHASVGLSKFENELGKAILAAQRQIGSDPSILDVERLADLYFDYATSGFLDYATSDYYLSRAKEQYHLALRIEPRNTRLQTRLLRALVQTGDLKEAFALEEKIAPHSDELDILLLGMEMRYKAGDFSQVVELSKRASKLVPDDHPEREIVSTWAGASSEQRN